MSRLGCSVVLIVVWIAVAIPAVAAEYYVSPGGNDTSGDGSQSRPWRTIQKAADTMSAGDTCHVLDGEYAEMVRPARSGAAGQYISFVAEGSSVSVVGTRPITGWTVHSGNIWKASTAWDFGELFVDRQRMVLARWPNLTSGDLYRPNFYQATANGGDWTIIDAVHLTQPSGSWTGAKIFMVPGLGWTADQREVTDYNPANHQIWFYPTISFSDYYDADQYSLYFLYDKLSLLDAPSEWFLDRAADTVYVWLPDGSNPNAHLVEASGGSGGFDLTSRSYIRVTGFKLMSGDIKMLNATGCLVEGVQHLYPAAELSVSGSDNVITRSEIAYASYTGVRLAGTRNTLSKSHVHHTNYWGTYNSLVELGNSEDWPNGGSQNAIVDCSLHDTGRDGVSILSGLDVSGCLIEHNEIYNAGLIAKDCGGFYSYLTNGGGTVIRYNIVHDSWPKESPQYGPIALGGGIYLDENSSSFSVHHNVVYRTPGSAIILHQASRNNLVYNNTAVGSGGGWAPVIDSSPGGNWFGVDGTVVANNVAAMLDDRTWAGGWSINFNTEVPAYHHNGYYNLYNSTRLNSQGVEDTGVVGDPLFSNAAANDFSLLAGSPMIDRGVVIPGITDGYVGAAPDIGAYERGGSARPGPRLPTPVVTWATPASIVAGTPLSATQLNATANVPGTFVYTPAATTVLTAGTHTLSVTVRPTDATSYTTATKTVTIVVAPAEYYVSPGGNDTSGDGSQSRPWRTIQKAADTMSAGDTCHVLDGEYAEMVRPARSGAAGQYISFVAEGSSVSVVGTRPITGWTVHSGNIWKASAAWDFGELFVDRQRMVLARWPNLTSGDLYRPNFYQATANGGKTSIIDADHLTQPSGYWTGAKIYLLAGLGWSAEQLDVTGYDPATHRVAFSNATFTQYYDADQYSLYFLYDKLSLLDAPSEWFLDRAADVVYVWLPNGDNPNAHLVEASGASGGFDLTSRSYIRVAGFSLMSGDIKMLDATGCLVEDVRHLYPATELSVSGSDNVITRSEIAYASYTGVRLAGTRNTLSKSHVHHCNYFGTNNSIVELGNNSIWPSGGSQNSIVDCTLHDGGHEGVSVVGARDLSACLIEHNEIYNAGLIAKDLGGFYCYSTNGGGTEIKYNIVHDIWPKESLQWGPIRLGVGIYLDENSSGFLVHHNVAYRTGGYAIMLHQASRNNLVYNNTAVGSGGGWGDVINSSPGGNYFGVDGTVVANNVAAMLDHRTWGPGWSINFDTEVPAYHHNGYYNLYNSTRLNSQGVEDTGVVGDPLFSNAAANDFSLLAGSPMIDKGVVIPGVTDGYLGAAPDIGAYERGGSERPGPRLPTPVVTWANPASIVYGTPLSATQLNATANVPGTFVYTPAATTVLTAGTHTLWVTVRPTDPTSYTTATKTVTIVVAPMPTVSLSPAALHFAGTNAGGTLSPITPAQTVTVSFSSSTTTAWSAAADQSWVQITNGSGTGSGAFTVSMVNPGNILGSATSATATITVTAAGASNSPQIVAVTLTLRQASAHVAPFGTFDTPGDGTTGMQGSFAVTGWALDDVGVDHVEIWRDLATGEDPAHAYTTDPAHPGYSKVYIATPLFVTGARPDIEGLYPTYPFAYRAGWGYLLLSWGLHAQGNGTYTLYAFAYDVDGHHATLGSKTITVDNAHATKPFGALDTPSYGGTVTGPFWNYGWALTPNATPACTIVNRSVTTHIDSGPGFVVNYGDPRPDIAGSFSGFSNGSNSGGAYYIDTTQLSNGVHSIGWLVYDSCGRGDGIGSRFFTVLNGGARPDESSVSTNPAELSASARSATARPRRSSTSEVGEPGDPRLATVPAAVPSGTPPPVETAARPSRDPEAAAAVVPPPAAQPAASSGVVSVRHLGGEWEPVPPNADGTYVVEIAQGGRIEVQLPPAANAAYEGHVAVNGERRDLPVGSSLDTTAGIFYWQPAPAFLGVFDLVFEARGIDAVRVRVVVK